MSRILKFGPAIALAMMTLWLGACAASPRQRPVGMGDVNTGTGSLESARRQLAGTWRLTQFEVIDSSGKLVPVRAKAQLTYDEFGNMSIKGVLEEPLPGQKTITDAPALMYEGRATIDAARQELVLTGKSSVEPDPAIVAKLGLDARRKYTVTAEELTMSAVDTQGRVTSRATYRK